MRRIKIYSSFEDQKKEELDFMLSLSYEERVERALKMIRKVFPISKSHLPRRITIVKPS